jgi:NAD dependent epimerase/dehydratase family enzyme
MPWVHLDDAVGLALRALDDAALAGALNVAAPEAARNADFTRALAGALSRPALLPVPAFAVRAALGDLAGELLASRLVLPARAEGAGYAFRHPALAGALAAEV